MIRETYETGYPAFDKLGLVYRLLDKAEESKSDPPARFALLQEARKLAVEAGQVELALDVIDCLAGEYQVRAAEAKAEVIEQLAKKIHSLPQRKAMVESALEVMNEAIAEDNVDLARQMGKQASQLVWPTKDRVLVQETVAQNKELEAAAKACAEAKAALAALKDNPRDPDANLVLGKHLCFAKDDWEKGLPMLARGSNAALRALAERDLRGAATVQEQVKLGDAWWAAHGKQRAAYWYERALPGLKSLERDLVRGRVFGEAFGRRAVDLLAWADFERDDADGKWGKWARNGADATCVSFPPLSEGKQDDWATLALPVDASGQYDLQVSFTRIKAGETEHDEILIDFPVGAHNCALAIGELGSGLGNIDGKNCYRNSTTTSKVKLVDGRRYKVLLKVRRIGDAAMIDVALDGQPLIHWQGREASLSNVSPYIQQVPNLPRRFYLSTRSLATFHAAELRMVTGKAKWIP